MGVKEFNEWTKATSPWTYKSLEFIRLLLWLAFLPVGFILGAIWRGVADGFQIGDSRG